MIHDIEDKELAAHCGLYCGACSMKNGQIRDTATQLQRMLEAYQYAEWAPLVAELFPATRHYPEFESVLQWLTTQDCPGCVGGGGPPQCAVRLCAREKAIAGCWDCTEVDCDTLKGINQTLPTARQERQRIRDVGLEAWLAEQAARAAEGFSYFDALYRHQ